MITENPPKVKPKSRDFAECFHGNPACVRFGGQDPRAFLFNYLLLAIDDPDAVNDDFLQRQLDGLAKLGFRITLEPRAYRSPTMPVMTQSERAAFDRGELMNWMNPRHIAGSDD